MPRARPQRHLTPAGRAASGYTLVEMMVAISVAAILAAIAIPSMRAMLQNGRLTAAVNDLLASVNRARTEALKQQLPTAMCFTADPAAANPVCSYTAARGWIVFIDSNGDWAYSAGEPLLERHSLLDSALTVKTDGDAIVAFAPSGFATPSAAHQAMRNAVFCDARGVVATPPTSTARALVVATTGRARAVSAQAEVLAALGGASCP